MIFFNPHSPPVYTATMKHVQYTVFFLAASFLATEVAGQETSPCPRIFTYEPKGPESDRWYGLLTLLHDSDLNGVWLRMVFDKPIIQLGNWFGEVNKKGPGDYLIKNPSFQLKARSPKVVRIFVKYNANEPPPKLVQFRINAKIVCPEYLTTTTSTTTETLFTSNDEDGSSGNQFVTTQAPVAPQTPFGLNMNQNENFQESTTTANINRPPHVPAEQSNDVCGLATNRPAGNEQYQVAYKGQFPWHAMLYYTKDITIVYLCGAALISKHHLLTVAHCVIKSQTQVPVNPERLIVYLGKYYVKHWSHEGVQTRYISQITPHPGYNSGTYDNEIAVLKLLYPAEISDYIRPICLWDKPTDIQSLKNRPGTVAGWGFDETGKVEDKLMYVQMFAQENDVCSRVISNYTERFSSRNTYCANFIDDSVECVGDSGGAMVFQSDSSVWHLRGLITVSVVLQHHLKCGRDRYVVFTDVAKYQQWIKENANLL